jgi:hypothetical protein
MRTVFDLLTELAIPYRPSLADGMLPKFNTKCPRCSFLRTKNRRKNQWTTIKRVIKPSYDPALLPPPRKLDQVLDAY